MSDAYRVIVRGGVKAGGQLERTARATGPRTAAAVGELGDKAQGVLRRHAPKRSRRLELGIVQLRSLNLARPTVVIVADARDPLTGFDYLDVTRFGHRTARIVPRPDRQAASVRATGGPRATGARAALRFVMGGRVLYRRSVRGYHPASDWVEDSLPEVEIHAATAERRLARDIVRAA